MEILGSVLKSRTDSAEGVTAASRPAFVPHFDVAIPTHSAHPFGEGPSVDYWHGRIDVPMPWLGCKPFAVLKTPVVSEISKGTRREEHKALSGTIVCRGPSVSELTNCSPDGSEKAVRVQGASSRLLTVKSYEFKFQILVLSPGVAMTRPP